MSQGNGNELVAIACGKCGTRYRVHAPGMMRMNSAACSQALLFPTWSVDERICPGCGTLNAPAIGNVQLVWVPMEAKEPSRIIPATAMPAAPPTPPK